MGDAGPPLSPYTETQRRVFIDTTQVYEAYVAAERAAAKYRGGMHWKTAKGRQYLFKKHDREGHGRSLGPRSRATEKVLDEFRRGKREARATLSSLKRRVEEQARFCKAAGIQRVPSIAARILRVLEERGGGLTVVGTNALYAYEAAAGVFMDSSVTATGDLDLLWDARSRLDAAIDPAAGDLLAVLREADRSFRLLRAGGFRAVNRDGYLVDLITPAPGALARGRTAGRGAMTPAEIRRLEWLVSAPKMETTAVGADGVPVRLVVPDPRAFVVNKLWLSGRKDRDPIKKPRDRAQAVAVATVVRRYLPAYEFKSSKLRMFPRGEVESALRLVGTLS